MALKRLIDKDVLSPVAITCAETMSQLFAAAQKLHFADRLRCIDNVLGKDVNTHR